MPKIDRKDLTVYDRQVYPGGLRQRTDGFSKVAFSDAGLTQFGIGEVTLQPGGATGLYHYHETEDEAVYVLEGEATVIEGGEAYTLKAGECAIFKGGDKVGHTVENRSDKPIRLLEIGTKNPDEVAVYPGIDMKLVRNQKPFFRTRDGEPITSDQTPGTIDEPDTYANVNPLRERHD